MFLLRPGGSVPFLGQAGRALDATKKNQCSSVEPTKRWDGMIWLILPGPQADALWRIGDLEWASLQRYLQGPPASEGGCARWELGELLLMMLPPTSFDMRATAGGCVSVCARARVRCVRVRENVCGGWQAGCGCAAHCCSSLRARARPTGDLASG